MLEELKRRGGTVVGEAAERPAKMGYVPVVPEHRESAAGPREVHLGWSDRARPDAREKYTLYLESRTVSFERVDDQKRVRDMPGADNTPGNYVAFRFTAPGGLDHAMAAAQAVKRAASSAAT
jgi:hypothetical protein